MGAFSLKALMEERSFVNGFFSYNMIQSRLAGVDIKMIHCSCWEAQTFSGGFRTKAGRGASSFAISLVGLSGGLTSIPFSRSSPSVDRTLLVKTEDAPKRQSSADEYPNRVCSMVLNDRLDSKASTITARVNATIINGRENLFIIVHQSIGKQKMVSST